MDENIRRYNDEGVEIDIKDMFFFMLGKWRVFIAAVLVGAVLCGGVYVLKSVLAADTEETEMSAADFNENDYDIAEDSIRIMETAYQYRLRYDELQEYMTESLAMQIDPNGVYRGTLQYGITGSDDPEGPAVALRAILLADGIWDELKEASGLDFDAKYFSEVVSAEVLSDEEGPYAVTFTVDSVSEESCAAMLSLLQGKADDAAAGIAGNTEVTADSVLLTADDTYLEERSLAIDNLNTYRSYITTLEGSLEDDELVYYENVYLVNKDADAASDTAESVVAEASDTPTSGGSGICASGLIKWALIGALVGIVCWGVWYVCRYIFYGKVQCESDITSLYGLDIIGNLKCGEDEGKGIDAAIAGLRRRAAGHNDSAAHIAGLLANLDCESAAVCLDSDDSAITKAVEDILAGAGGRYTKTCWISRDEESLSLAKKAGAAVIVVCMDQTAKKDLKRELECCSLQKVRVLGVVCVEV